MSVCFTSAKLSNPSDWQKIDLSKLSNSELLAFTIGHGQEVKFFVKLSKQVLNKISPACLLQSEFEDLVLAGLDSQQANNLLVAIEMFRRFCRQRLQNVYYSQEVIYQEFKKLRSCTQERLIVGYLDRYCCQLCRKKFLLKDVLDPDFSVNQIFDPILKLPTQQLIIARNHTVGGAEPTEQDLILFKKFYQVCQAFGVEMLDKVIFSRRGFYSFRKAGLLKTIN